MGREKKPAEREFNVQVGARISSLRKEFGWQQKELAERLGVSSSLLYSYENGISACPAFRLRQIAVCLEVSLADLVPNLSTHCGLFLRGTQKRLRLSAERKDPEPGASKPGEHARYASRSKVGRSAPASGQVNPEETNAS